MIKAKDEWNEWRDEIKAMKIEGAENFALWLTTEHNLPIKGINKNLKKWKEQLK